MNFGYTYIIHLLNRSDWVHFGTVAVDLDLVSVSPQPTKKKKKAKIINVAFIFLNLFLHRLRNAFEEVLSHPCYIQCVVHVLYRASNLLLLKLNRFRSMF